MHNEASRDYNSAHLTNSVCVYRGIFVFSPWHWSTCLKLELHVLLDEGSSSTKLELHVLLDEGSSSTPG
jgi:hypothetical protein